MKELLELRIPEDRAGLLFGPKEGQRLGSSVRRVLVNTNDRRMVEIAALQARLRQEQGRPFFYGWDLLREYSKTELAGAALLYLQISAAFEPVGEDCGTQYDEASACPRCGAGREQLSDLVLDLRKAPKSKQIARTIADEWIVNQQLADLIATHEIRGCALKRVRHKSRFQDDPIDYLAVPTGRLLYDLAERQGIRPAGSTNWQFTVWLNRPEQRRLMERADEEWCKRRGMREKRKGKSPPAWYQLIVNAPKVHMTKQMRFGIGPFEDDQKKEFVCPFGHTKGLNLLSEVFVQKRDYDGADITCTIEYVGWRQGVLVPAPLLLISQRFYQLLESHGIKGYSVEVAHLV